MVAAVVVVLLAALVGLRSFSASPPIAAFERARLALSRARRAGANIYAAELLRPAEAGWKQATQAWGNENKKWFFRRDFRAAWSLAGTVQWQAQRAETLAVATRDSLQFTAAAELTMVKQKIDEFKNEFARVPVAAALRKKFVTGELAMIEGEYAFNRQDYWQAAAKAQSAAELVGSAGADATKVLQTYLTQVSKWKQWAVETIAWSAQQNAAAIVVDKMAHRSRLYVAGRLKAEYHVDLGPRWLGHKKQKGDGATPEGHYRVIKKKGPGQSKYYKALELDYPNEDDRQNFLAAQKNGELPRSAHIGGLIEIHGDGGRGVNWTAGCVALRNQDMDELFALAPVGTRVTIVGALTERPAVSQTSVALAKKNLNGARPIPGSSQ
ncbi:L,D-transpeptidase [candidate division KSB1 bacterium]|nr:L,D-transpeptidase [candidate division KSB1 bacterium]